MWRLQGSEGNATYLRQYGDDRILFNLSVWESVEQLKNYVYRSAHAGLIKERKQWLEHFEAASTALWWIPAGHIPGVDEAKKRLEHLDAHGPSQFAFTFRSIHQPDEAFLSSFDWSLFLPCAANP